MKFLTKQNSLLKNQINENLDESSSMESTLNEENTKLVKLVYQLKMDNKNVCKEISDFKCMLEIKSHRFIIVAPKCTQTDIAYRDSVSQTTSTPPRVDAVTASRSDKYSQTAVDSIHVSQKKSSAQKTTPRILILADSHGRNLANKFRDRLSPNYSVFCIFKPNATFEQTTCDLLGLTLDFNKGAHVIIMAGTNDALVKNYISDNSIEKTVAGLSHTNCLFVAVPYVYHCNYSMATNSKRTGSCFRASWTKQQLTEAIQAVNKNKMGVNEAAQNFGVPSTTLRRRKFTKNLNKGPLGSTSTLGEAAEKKLVNHILKLQKNRFSPTRTDVRSMGFKLAEQLGNKHHFSKEWLHLFLPVTEKDIGDVDAPKRSRTRNVYYAEESDSDENDPFHDNDDDRDGCCIPEIDCSDKEPKNEVEVAIGIDEEDDVKGALNDLGSGDEDLSVECDSVIDEATATPIDRRPRLREKSKVTKKKTKKASRNNSSSGEDLEVSSLDDSSDFMDDADEACTGCGKTYSQTTKSDDWVNCLRCSK
ncbi:hypothetical protein FQA39_LY06051 [Lamprigera yunnana]|nr:hypothetical protein FQA39_LY06051 [Lamprigera yunnana]